MAICLVSGLYLKKLQYVSLMLRKLVFFKSLRLQEISDTMQGSKLTQYEALLPFNPREWFANVKVS